MKFAILDQATETARLVDAEIFEGLDASGMTVIELPDDASWLGKIVDWDNLQIIDDIPQAQSEKWERVKAIAAERSVLASTPFGDVQADTDSKTNISGLVLDAQIAKGLGEAWSVDFTLADNSQVTLSATQIVAFGRAVAAHVMRTHAHSQALRQQIEAASTRAELDAIEVEAGWP